MPRSNPARSGGPRSAAGRVVTSRNALAHGAYAAQVVLPGEASADFERLEESLQSDFNPRNMVEAALVRDVAVLLWKKWRIEKAAHAVMVGKVSHPPSAEDFTTLFGNEKLPEGLELYAEKALDLTALHVDELRVMAQEAATLRNHSDRHITSTFLQERYPRVYGDIETQALERGMAVSEFVEKNCNSTFGFSELFQLALAGIEVCCNCSLWVWERRDQVRARLKQIKESRILELMQDPATSRATDDLNRALYRTLAELRKQQDWRLHTHVQDVAIKAIEKQ